MDLKSMSFIELYKLYFSINKELLYRSRWVVLIIFIFLVIMVFSKEKSKKMED